VQTSTSFIQFEKAVDHLEFIKLLEQQEFNSVKLKVQPFGFTNSDYQECGKPMMWQDSACKLFNAQWYPTDTAPSEDKNTSVSRSADEWNTTHTTSTIVRYFSNTKKRELSSESISQIKTDEKKRKIQFVDEEILSDCAPKTSMSAQNTKEKEKNIIKSVDKATQTEQLEDHRDALWY
jgi:hypothetical protein